MDLAAGIKKGQEGYMGELGNRGIPYPMRIYQSPIRTNPHLFLILNKIAGRK